MAALAGTVMERCGPVRARFLFHADPAAVTRVLGDVVSGVSDATAGLGQAGCDPGVLELVLAEVLNNVVEHAYRDRSDGVIELAYSVIGGQVAVEVMDNGHPMPGEALPAGTLPDMTGPLADLPEGGFGWHLIRSLTQDLHYHRQGGRNRLRFAVPLGCDEMATAGPTG